MDYATQVLLWHHDFGPSPVGLCLVDIDGDGKIEILCGSDAVDNLNQAADATDDHHSHVFAFAPDGRLLWTRPMGDYFTSCRPLPANLEGHSRKAILAWLYSQYEGRSLNGDPELGFVLRLDDGGNVTARAGARPVLSQTVHYGRVPSPVGYPHYITRICTADHAPQI